MPRDQRPLARAAGALYLSTHVTSVTAAFAYEAGALRLVLVAVAISTAALVGSEFLARRVARRTGA